jgi:hypothetical protein
MRPLKRSRGASIVAVAMGAALLLFVTALPAYAVHTVTGVFPASAATTTNCQVTITGAGFAGITAVKFGAVPAASFTVDSTTQITATLPAGLAAGSQPITVEIGVDIQPVGGLPFSVVPGACPSVTSFNPLTGPVGSAVLITGTGFLGAAQVKFGNTVQALFTVNATGTLITTTVPAGVTGPVAIRVVNVLYGQGSSASLFTVTGTAVPTITSFTPTSGPVGTSVTINGTNFTGATSVSFNNVVATAGWTVNATGTQITGAIVPSAATDGPIRVVTPGGTAVSTTNFDVTGVSGAEHPRTVSLQLSGNRTLKVTGNVDATDGYANCEANVGVKIQKQKSGGWKTLTTLQTNSGGSYKGYVPAKSGTYRAKAPKVTLLNDAVCGGDRSPTKKF